MGFRFQRRLNLGSGFGINWSKAGAAPSARTFLGSAGSKGFSVKTGLRGLSYRKSRSKTTSGAVMTLAMLAIVLLVNASTIAASLIASVLILLLQGLTILIVAAVNVCLWVVMTAWDFGRHMTTTSPSQKKTKL